MGSRLAGRRHGGNGTAGEDSGAGTNGYGGGTVVISDG